MPKTFFFEKPNETTSCFSKCFSKHSLLKHADDAFFVLRNADFLGSKMPRNFLEEKFCS